MQSTGTFFWMLGTFPAGISHHGKWRDYLDGIRPSREPFPRELATTGMHVFFCTGTDHYGKTSCGDRPPHGKSSRGNRLPREIFPRELVTMEIRDFLPRNRPPCYFTGRGWATATTVFLVVFVLINNPYQVPINSSTFDSHARYTLDMCLDIGCEHIKTKKSSWYLTFWYIFIL